MSRTRSASALLLALPLLGVGCGTLSTQGLMQSDVVWLEATAPEADSQQTALAALQAAVEPRVFNAPSTQARLRELVSRETGGPPESVVIKHFRRKPTLTQLNAAPWEAEAGFGFRFEVEAPGLERDERAGVVRLGATVTIVAALEWVGERPERLVDLDAERLTKLGFWVAAGYLARVVEEDLGWELTAATRERVATFR